MTGYRRKPRQPSYRLHKPSGQAVVTVDGKDHYLGPHGSPESHCGYAKWISRWQDRHGVSVQLEADRPHALLSVNELLEACWNQHFKPRYSKNGKPTKEAANLLTVIKTVSHLYGMSPAKDFGPRKLKAIRRHMIEVQELARTEINKRIGRIKWIYKFAASEEMVRGSLCQDLATVAGLRIGEDNVRESKPVKPVPDLYFCLVLPFVSRQVAAMMLVQRVTGMRPGETCIMRPREIDTTGRIWEYIPFQHKNQWRGHERVVPIGPFAQQILTPFLNRPSDSFLFSPQEAEKERNAARRRKRRTPLTPSQRMRIRKSTSKRPKRDRYDTDSYRRAVNYGIRKARREGYLVPHWHPHQLRHTHGTEVRKVFGIEEAQTSLGTGTDVVARYAQRNLELANKVAKRMG